MGFFGKLFGGEKSAAPQEAAHVHTEPVGDTAAENVFFGEHKAAQERAVADRELAEQEAKDTEALAAAQNAIEDDETLEEERAA